MSKIPLGRPRGQMSESMLTAAFIILSGGLQDAYTYLCRGKVFANAQTGNIVLFSAISSTATGRTATLSCAGALVHAGYFRG